MTDIIEHAEAALKSDCLDSSLAVFVQPLIAELKAARAESEQWKALWRQNTANASDAMRERDATVAENERLKDEFTTYVTFAEQEIERLHQESK